MRTCESCSQSEANPPSKVKYSRARSPNLEEIEVIGSPMFFYRYPTMRKKAVSPVGPHLSDNFDRSRVQETQLPPKHPEAYYWSYTIQLPRPPQGLLTP